MDNKIDEQLNSDERTTSSTSLFFIWLAATTSITSTAISAIMIKSFPGVPILYIYILSFSSYFLLGICSIPGFLYGIPTMVYSSYLFPRFSKFISIANWLSQIGWQVILVIMTTYVIEIILFNTHKFVYTIFSLFIGTVLCYTAPILGVKTITKLQYFASFFLVISEIYIVLYYKDIFILLTKQVDANVNIYSMISAFSLVITLSVLSWTMFSSDYSRHVTLKSSKKSIFIAASLGGGLGSSIALISGSVLFINSFISFNKYGIAIDPDTFPHGFYLTYLSLSIIGLVATNAMNIYSSSINLGVIFNVMHNRTILSVLNMVVVEFIAIIILYSSSNFLDDLRAFLGFFVLVAAPWSGFIVVDVLNNIWHNIALNKKSSTINSKYLLLSILFTSIYYFYSIEYCDNFTTDMTALVGLILGILSSLLSGFHGVFCNVIFPIRNTD